MIFRIVTNGWEQNPCNDPLHDELGEIPRCVTQTRISTQLYLDHSSIYDWDPNKVLEQTFETVDEAKDAIKSLLGPDHRGVSPSWDIEEV